MPSNQRMTVGELVAAFLEASGVRAAFGVISIHNMPILDAFGRRAAAAAAKGAPAPIRFVPARSEPGAVNMADAYARVSGGLGVAVTSTGTAAGNACGAMVEALTAGTPVLHLTGQIEVPYLDRELAYIHEAPEQLDMLPRGVQSRVPRAQRRDRARHAARGGARRPHPAVRPGERRDPDRHPGDRDRRPGLARAAAGRPAPGRGVRARRARRAPRAGEAARCSGSAAARGTRSTRSNAWSRSASAS